jgi:hypothetical protein
VTSPHSPECDCPTCERLNVGEFAYREIAEELASDDPAVIDPIWLERCEARIAAYQAPRIEPAALLGLLQPDRRHAAA